MNICNGREIEYYRWDPLDDGFEDMDGCFHEIDTSKFFSSQDKVFSTTWCPYCSTELRRFYHVKGKDYSFDAPLAPYFAEIHLCNRCYFWRYRRHIESQLGLFSGPIHSLAISKAATFKDIEDDDLQELSRHILRNVGALHHLAPTVVEKLVAEVYKAHFSDAEVIHVGRPADGGKDIIFIDANSEKLLIEVKARRSANYVEPVGTIRNLLGAMVGGDTKTLKGIVVSTGDHYSYQAQAFSKGLASTAYSIELTDRGKLLRMLPAVAVTEKYIDAVEFDGSNDEFNDLIRNSLS